MRAAAQPLVSLGTCSRAALCCASSTDGKVIPEPSYAIPGTLLGICLASTAADNKILAAVTGILGLFLAIQATRVKFIFDKETLVRLIPARVCIGSMSIRGALAWLGQFDATQWYACLLYTSPSPRD